MSERVRVSSKGQIVIPKNIRDELGIKKEDCLILEYDEFEMEIISRKITNFLNFRGILKISSLNDENRIIEAVEEEIGKDIQKDKYLLLKEWKQK